MKTFIKYTFPLLLLSSCTQQQDENIEEKLRNFYAYYITVNDGTSGKAASKDTLEKYCTRAFLQKIYSDTDIDYDPIISGQDFDKEWVKTLTVTKATAKRDKIYRVSFLWDAKEMKSHNIVVTMGKEAGKWKIDYVQDNE